jgi:MoxR-like ATPase
MVHKLVSGERDSPALETSGERKRAAASRHRQFLRALNLYGLDHLEPVILAALADEAPLLLIGAHGTAKSALLNRVAAALDLAHRHYNASLISFDDLLGYPIPNASRTGIDYLRMPDSLWDAESVFLDEISRCRPEVQNKLFSIVHERRVQGLPLERLRYRWAAMNPPPALDPDDAAHDAAESYDGSIALDPALADRFPYVVVVPGVNDLGRDDRLALIGHGARETPSAASSIRTLIESTRAGIADADAGMRTWVQQYVEALVDPLREAGLAISGRRAGSIYRITLAIHAASRALGLRANLPDCAFLALKCGLPHRARGVAIDEAKLGAVHRAAIAVAGSTESSIWRRLRRVADPVERLALAIQTPSDGFGRLELSALVSDVWAGLTIPQHYILARHLLPRLADAMRVTVPVYELVAAPLLKVHRFESEPAHTKEVHRSGLAPYQLLIERAAALGKQGANGVALGNTLLALRFAEDETFDVDVLIELDGRWKRLFEGSRTNARDRDAA